MPELGDVVITQSNQDPLGIINAEGTITPGHVVLVSEVHGYTPDKILIIEGNPNEGIIVQNTLAELMTRGNDFKYLIYGHPNISTTVGSP